MKTILTSLLLLFSLSLCAQEKPEFIDKPYLSIDNKTPIPIEENQILIKYKGANAIMLMTTSDVPSTVVPSGSDFKFVINLKNQEIVQGLVLYQLESVKDGLALVMKGMKAQEQLAEKTIKLNFKEISDGLYEIVPSKELVSGDYAFNLVMTSFVFRVE